MQCNATSRRSKPPPPPPVSTPQAILPHYGPGPKTTTYNSDLVLALPFRGLTASRVGTFAITSTVDNYMYYAYPVSYGLATIVDRDNGLAGAWDGALNHFDTDGPDTVMVNIEGQMVQFYLYRSEFSFNATTRWRVT
jgi:hypothetical protein